MFRENAAIPITQEAKVMRKGVIVYCVPITTDKGTDKQQEGRLRLVEISDELIHDVELIAGLDHNLRLSMQDCLPGGIYPVEKRL